MANKRISVVDRSANQQRESILSVARSQLGEHRKAIAGRFMSILAVLGFLSFASPAFAAGPGTWSATLTNLDTNTTYSTQTYPTMAQAVAAMKALDPADDTYGGRQILAEAPAQNITPTHVTYPYTAPDIVPPPVTTAYQYLWFSDAYGQPAGIYFPDEASAVAAATVGTTCSTTSSIIFWSPSGSWSAAGAPPLDQEQRAYQEMTTSYYSQGGYSLGSCQTYALMGDSGLVTSPLIRTYSYYCPTGYNPQIQQYRNNVQVPPYCHDKFKGSITGNMLECPSNGSPSTSVGDPCDISTGDFSQTESDFSGAGLSFQRYYHSATLESSHNLGVGWTHNYAAYLVLTNGVPTGLLRPNGHQDALISTSTSGVYISLSGAAIHVQASGANWAAILKDGSSEIYTSAGQLSQLVTPGGLITTLSYNSNNQLSAVSGPFGQSLQFSYNSTTHQLQQLIDPAGKTIVYGYNTTTNNLTSVTYQDSTKRTYLYTNSTFPNNLTGIVDESNTQFLTVTYDPTTGAATSSQQAGGAQAVSMTYSANGAVATDALGATHTYTFTNDPSYAPRVTALATNTLTQTFAVPTGATDSQRRVTQSVDANGNITTYAYDANHLTSKTQASGTSVARTTSYQYLSTLSALPTLVTEPLRQTSYQYYSGTNNVQYKTVTDTTVTPTVARTWTYTYDSYGRVLTAKGPRTDVNSTTTTVYYTCTTGTQCGQVETITNAVGQVTTFNTYNAYGQPLTITDPNGIVTTLTYDLRQRVKSREVGTETTSYSYYPTGLLETVTLPDSSTVEYTYDGAHRLTDITDGVGNHTHYTLDAMGNHIAENVYDPSNTLRRTHTRVINALNELYQDINAADTAAVTTTFGYDKNGNKTSSDAPLSRNTVNEYDPLNRLEQVTDPANGVTKLAYDANDQLISVIDPRTLSTTYTRNGFGDVAKQVSPDTGTTTTTYDSGGNLKTATDARGAEVTNTYDALNRVTQQAYSDDTINFTYDAGTNGKGRLTGASDANHSLSWSYDPLGRITGKGQTVGGVTKSVGYAYTNSDLVTLLTPSGQSITYGYTNHRITSITVNSTSLLTGVTYFPFGPVSGWTWGNASTVSRTYNTDGHVSKIATAGDVLTFGYDNALRISSLSDTLFSTNGYTAGYDALDRLNSLAQTGVTSNWTYDADGNHRTQTGTSTVTTTPSTTSNRVNSLSGSLVRTYAYDAAGNTSSYTGASFGFNQRGRMSSATVGSTGASYIYNALGQLIEKNVAGVTTLLMYDEAGHLLGEYSSTGALIQETVWMNDTPVATLRPNGSSVTIYYVHTDHLNAPRIVTQPSSNEPTWLWGGNAANQNPLGLGTFIYNLRYPGQYYQAETGLFYNYHRDYDPATGRYLESDPIGLLGGINTYSYVNNNSISNIDPQGLVKWNGTLFSFGLTAPFGAVYDEATLYSECVNGKTLSITISAVGPAAGVGVKVSATVSDISFEDNQSTLDPNGFDGAFTTGTATGTFGALPTSGQGPGPVSRIGPGLPGVGVGVGYVQFGRNFSNPLPPGLVVGRDMSVTGAVGTSTVTSVTASSCNCGSQ